MEEVAWKAFSIVNSLAPDLIATIEAQLSSISDGKGTKGLPITQELEWDEAWSRIHQLRASDPTSTYDAGQDLFLHYWETTIQ